ncbi:virulence-associated e family protein [Chitinophaga polysaccharea]|uniref:VapE domain-containing protein n=1 Tax=Chitinophaga polysaccharea TaxID=1293035 RepID=UPI001455BFB0|nr:VapE domain-containing protein [Chitinophaga polysaccharea]NLR58155.1 virulence-associated e family protein [Chitinophaga polysaccharea]
MNNNQAQDSPLIDNLNDLDELTNIPLGSQVNLVEWGLQKKYDSRYNIIKGHVEIKKKNETEYRQLNDYVLNSIMRDLAKNGIRCTAGLLANILHSDFSEAYDLFKVYIKALPEWDKIDRFEELAATVECENKELWKKHLTKWIVAMIASLSESSVINHTVLVLVGAQGIGKTTWLLRLIPPELKEQAFMGFAHPDNKDTIVNLSECMLIILDELETMNRKGIGMLKELITQSQIRVRRPYARNAETLVRRASFAGSVNSTEFLNDFTGSRRFLCHEVKKVNYNHSINLNQLYAQAYHLYNTKFQFWFNDNEIAEVARSNDKFQVSTPEEEFLLQYFEPGSKGKGKFKAPAEIITFLQKVTQTKVALKNTIMGKSLTKNGFERKKVGGRYGYYLLLKDKAVDYDEL